MDASPIVPLKQCSKKDQCVHPEQRNDGWLPATSDYFLAHKDCKFGLRPECRECHKAYKKRYFQENKEQIRERVRRQREIHGDEMRARHREYSRKWVENNPEKRREAQQRYNAAHRDENRERIRQYAKAHPDVGRASSRRYYERHREKVLEAKRLYARTHRPDPEKERVRKRLQYARNPEKAAVNVRNRIARKRRAEGKHTIADIRAQYARQKGRCYYCNCALGKKYHVDHVVPLCRGGRNSPDNLVVACQRCNHSKGAKLPHEWAIGGRLL